ncbi:hypothetical protein [Humidesulfovibrio mexicanus]|nr:hypothetical protein [Humidesulfovibrio mexicanus]
MRYTHIEAGNPLPRVAFILVFVLELAVRALLGQESPEAWTAPLGHASLAWLAIRFVCFAVDSLYGRLCISDTTVSASRSRRAC